MIPKNNELEELINGKMDKSIEGTWKPILTTLEDIEPTITYASQRGTYKKIGKLVYIDFYIRGKITALNGTNNYACIKGLPFSTKSVALGETAINLGVLYSLIENPINVKLNIHDARIKIQNAYGASASRLQVTSTNYFEVGGSGWYVTV